MSAVIDCLPLYRSVAPRQCGGGQNGEQVAYTFADRRAVRTWTQKAQATTSRCIQEAVQNGLDSVAIGFECASGVDRAPAALNLVRSSLERDGFIARARHCTIHLKACPCSSCMYDRENGPRGQAWEQTLTAFYERWQAAARHGEERQE